jgi:hypothetical protein
MPGPAVHLFVPPLAIRKKTTLNFRKILVSAAGWQAHTLAGNGVGILSVRGHGAAVDCLW